MPGGSILGGIVAESQNEDTQVFNVLFPKKRNELLMITDLSPDLMANVVNLEVIAERYNSKVLKLIAHKLYQALKSKDRQSSVEAIEVSLGMRRRSLEGSLE